mmetsp:Transcript_68179/g.197456  ORF Transcript_68179/g.197456 Transcript_68179/m.197456 type:complete len:779 (-) Transcript_68179:239-2575(-)
MGKPAEEKSRKKKFVKSLSSMFVQSPAGGGSGSDTEARMLGPRTMGARKMRMGGGSPDGAQTPMSPTTPLTALSKLLQGRKSFKKVRTAVTTGFATPEDKQRYVDQNKAVEFSFWRILVATAVLSSTLSFGIDQFTFVTGVFRERFTTFTNWTGLAGIIVQDVILVIIARLVVRTTMECEGSGFPEMKAMLFGTILDNYLTVRVLLIKAFGLAMLLAAGLPVGKEGPNCHMAACIARNLDRDFVAKRSRSAVGQNQITKLLLAACAVGVGASFSAPIGGVIFSMELMLPQVQDFTSYWGCFLAGISGSFVYEILRTWFAGATSLLPLISTDVLPGEGATSKYPCLRMFLDIGLGIVCGFLGGHWIRMHDKCTKLFKAFRFRANAPAGPSIAASGSAHETLLGGEKKEGMCARLAKHCRAMYNFQWRDLLICSMVSVFTTICAATFPLLNGKPQPLLLSNLFAKEMIGNSDEWVVHPLGIGGTLFCCFLVKWVTTFMSLSLSMPTGVVAPTMIIGALIGRCYAHFLPDFVADFMLQPEDGSVVTADVKGAFYARFAILGAAAFCAAVCRAFAMAISVFEVLALPNSVLPLCSTTITAIFVANKVELPFFDKNLAGRGLGGIPALTFTDHADAPAFSIMRKIDVTTDCLYFKTRLFDMHELLKRKPKQEWFAVVRPLDDGEAVLVGSMLRHNVDRLISMLDPDGSRPETPVDLMDPELQRPSDGAAPLVDGCPPHVTPSTTVKEVYLVMKIAHGENVLYVTRDGCLLGEVTFRDLMSHQL